MEMTDTTSSDDCLHVLVNDGTANIGAFHSIKNSGLNYRKFAVANGTVFSRISRKDDNVSRYTQISKAGFRFSLHLRELVPDSIFVLKKFIPRPLLVVT